MDELTRRRLVHNEQLFRAVNDQVEEAHPQAREVEVVCECSDRACTGRIRLSTDEYREIRARPDRFVVLPGHAVVELERVVESGADYAVVEKRAA